MPASIPNTFKNLELGGDFSISPKQLQSLYDRKILFDNLGENITPSTIDMIYRKISKLRLSAAKIIVNYLFEKIENMDSIDNPYAHLYRGIYAKTQELYGSNGKNRSLFRYTFTEQCNFCIRMQYFKCVKVMLSTLIPTDQPDLLWIAIGTGDKTLFYEALNCIRLNENTEVLFYLPHMKTSAEEKYFITKDLLIKNIGVNKLHRAISAAIDAKAKDLFDLFLHHPKCDVKKWSCYVFRQAIYAQKDLYYATQIAFHPSFDIQSLINLQKEYEKDLIKVEKIAEKDNAIEILKWAIRQKNSAYYSPDDYFYSEFIAN